MARSANSRLSRPSHPSYLRLIIIRYAEEPCIIFTIFIFFFFVLIHSPCLSTRQGWHCRHSATRRLERTNVTCLRALERHWRNRIQRRRSIPLLAVEFTTQGAPYPRVTFGLSCLHRGAIAINYDAHKAQPTRSNALAGGLVSPQEIHQSSHLGVVPGLDTPCMLRMTRMTCSGHNESEVRANDGLN